MVLHCPLCLFQCLEVLRLHALTYALCMPMCLGHFRAAIPAGIGAILHAKILLLGCIVHDMLVWVSGGRMPFVMP